MMGREYFTVAAYITDGAIICRKCGDAAKLPVSQQLTEAEVYNQEWEGGLYCGVCDVEIVAPDETEETLTPEEKFPLSDWQYDVANGDTKLGYQDWLAHQMECDSATEEN